MDESRALRRAGWAGATAVLLIALGIALCSLVGVDAASATDAAIRARINSGAKQTAAGIGVPLLAVGVALLIWFAVGLRHVLERLSGDNLLATAVVPAAALLGGLIITGASIDVSSAFVSWSSDFTPDPATARVLGTAGALIGLTGLVGGGVMIAATTRIAQRARALPNWAIWVSYVVATLCLTGFWSGGMASALFALWLIGAVIGVLRVSRRTLEVSAHSAQPGELRH